MANLLEPGDTVDRRRVPASSAGGSPRSPAPRRVASCAVTRRWGEAVPNDEAPRRARPPPGARWSPSCTRRPRRVSCTRSRELGAALLGRDMLLMADCVTSLGGVPLDAGAWGVDYAYSCTQKCLAAPPGMSPVAVSERALERIARAAHAGAVLARPASCWRATGSSGRLPTTTRRPSCTSTRCTRRCGCVLDRGPRGALGAPRGGRRAPPGGAGGRGLELLADAGAPARPAHRGARARGRRRQGGPGAACCASTASRSAAALGPYAPAMWRIGLMGRNATIGDGRPGARRARRRTGRRARPSAGGLVGPPGVVDHEVPGAVRLTTEDIGVP